MIKVGLDIGSSKISCVVCDIKLNQKPTVLSFVSLPTLSMNKNLIVNLHKIKSEVKEVINIAAKESQTEIKLINLNIPVSFSESLFYDSKIFINNEPIDDLHLNKIINNSEFFNESENNKILMNYILSYMIDG